MYPWRDGAGDVRVALSVVVFDSGGGGRVAHAVTGKRLAALGHFWHGGEVGWCRYCDLRICRVNGSGSLLAWHSLKRVELNLNPSHGCWISDKEAQEAL